MKVKHVLLVDDNDIDNYINNRVINICKIAEVITIKNSAVEALKYLESVQNDFEEFPDIIFLDIFMPLLDGFGFLDEIAKFPKVAERKCHVVMLTSSSNMSDINRAFQYNMVKDYLIKPLKVEMFNYFLN